MNFFRTTSTESPPTPPTPPDEETLTDDETKTDGSGDKPETPMVTMPDGTMMDAQTFLNASLSEERAKMNEELLRVRTVSTSTTEEPKPDEAPTKPAWQIEVEDDDFQSDVEKSLVTSHNKLGTEVNKVSDDVFKVLEELKALREENASTKAQREIDDAISKHGITEAELKQVYNEFGGTVDSIPALTEIAVSRKATAEGNEQTRTNANNDRREAASKISGGGNAKPIGNDNDQVPGRGLDRKAVLNNDGAAIAAKYSAFSTRGGN